MDHMRHKHPELLRVLKDSPELNPKREQGLETIIRDFLYHIYLPKHHEQKAVTATAGNTLLEIGTEK